MDQLLTHGYVSRFEHTALRPRLHTEGFPQLYPQRTPIQGTSTEVWGNTITGSTQLLSLQTQPLYLEVRHKATTKLNQPHK